MSKRRLEHDTKMTSITWGDNSYAQAPGRLAGQWQNAAAGSETSLFIRNGKIWAVGLNTERSLSEEKEQLTEVSLVDHIELEAYNAVAVACGSFHFALLDEIGRVITWGASNEFGQVGHGEEKQGLGRQLPKPLKFPQYNVFPRQMRIRQVACGSTHTAFVSDTGELFSCGANDHGQLGIGNSPAARSSCGASDNAESIDQNTNFEFASKPLRVVGALCGLPIRQVACGSAHTICLSVSGDAYSWGRNRRGSLGLGNDYENVEKVSSPVRVEYIEGAMKAIAAGGHHSAFLRTTGQLFLCGDNKYGQLGQPLSSVLYTHIPLELPYNNFGLRVRQCSLGEYHTILLTDRGLVYAMGMNSENQLGGDLNSSDVCVFKTSTPKQVKFADTNGGDPCVRMLVSGARHNIALLSTPDESRSKKPTREGSSASDDNGEPTGVGSALASHQGAPQKECVWLEDDVSMGSQGEKSIESRTPSIISSGVSSLVQPGVNENVRFIIWSAGELLQSNTISASKVFTNFSTSPWNVTNFNTTDWKPKLEAYFCVPQIVNASFCYPNMEKLRLDIDTFLEVSKPLAKKEVIRGVLDGIVKLRARDLTQPDQIRCILIYLLLPVWEYNEPNGNGGKGSETFENKDAAIKAYQRITDLVARLPGRGRKTLINIIRDECSVMAARDRLVPNCVAICNLAIQMSMEKKGLVRPLWESILLLDIVWCGCQQWVESNKLPKTTFSLTSLTLIPPKFELELFIKHAQKKVVPLEKFVLEEWNDLVADVHPLKCGLMLEAQSFMSHPHLVPVAFKQKVLQKENEIEHSRSIQTNIAQTLNDQIALNHYTGQQIQIRASNIYFVVEIRRDYVLQDAIRVLSQAEPEAMRRPLKVKFQNEEGIDEGGVQREFFKLLMQQLFDTNFGMFKVDDDSGMLWFNPSASFLGVVKENFRLVGNIVGLAVYNNLPGLKVPFPSALFKKLTGAKTTNNDLGEISPSYANSIDAILNWSPSPTKTKDQIAEEFENTFGLDFSVCYQVVGTCVNVNLDDVLDEEENVKDAGTNQTRKVTYENREEFCQKLTDYVLNSSVQPMFKPFQQGFRKVCSSFVMDVLEWDDLQRIIRAQEDLDFSKSGGLYETARYDGGYRKDDPYIDTFWDILGKLEPQNKRQFLAFVTGSEFPPVGGLAELKLGIQKNGAEPTSRLPTAHTCFNLMLLPHYRSREKLERCLRLAIENAEGFGLQ